MSEEDAPGPGSPIVREARKRFKRCVDWEAVARVRWLNDVKFANADSDNLFQWPAALLTGRGYGTETERPCLTVNKTQQHCLQIINDARQNKTSIKIRPVGGGASYDAAQVLEGMVRHIEYISDAQAAYTTATRHQVEGGIGYFRIATDYAGPDTFEQEIFIRRVKDPLTIYVDPDFQEADGSDMRYAFVYDDMPRDEFNARYPKFKDVGNSPLGGDASDDGWITEDKVRVAEYFRKVVKPDRLVVMQDPTTGEPIQVRASKVPRQLKEHFDTVVDRPDTQWREITEDVVEWYLIAGDQEIDKAIWPGRYIPICRVPGIETIIDGELDRKGHTRALKDAQRMLNYNASAQVEFGALQNKIPYIGAAESIGDFQSYWDSANVQNYSFLPYNKFDEQGREYPAPQRAQPPIAAPAYQEGMANAENHMMLVSGQYQADVGAPSNERSGVAIQQRQRQGENATYHFIDHLALATRFAGKIILDLVPKIYDTRRMIKIMGEDGSDSDVTLDPQAQKAYAKQKAQTEHAAEEVIVNPNVGKYEVMSDVGPAFATRRQEAFNAYSQILAQNKELVAVAGDILFKNADFPGAEELAERLRRMVPPQALGDGPDPHLQQAQQQLQGAQQIIAHLTQELKDKQEGHAIDWSQKKIDAHKAETARIAALKDAFGTDPEGIQALVRQMVAEALNTPLDVAQLPNPHPIMNPPPEAPAQPESQAA